MGASSENDVGEEKGEEDTYLKGGSLLLTDEVELKLGNDNLGVMGVMGRVCVERP